MQRHERSESFAIAANNFIAAREAEASEWGVMQWLDAATTVLHGKRAVDIDPSLPEHLWDDPYDIIDALIEANPVTVGAWTLSADTMRPAVERYLGYRDDDSVKDTLEHARSVAQRRAERALEEFEEIARPLIFMQSRERLEDPTIHFDTDDTIDAGDEWELKHLTADEWATKEGVYNGIERVRREFAELREEQSDKGDLWRNAMKAYIKTGVFFRWLDRYGPMFRLEDDDPLEFPRELLKTLSALTDMDMAGSPFEDDDLLPHRWEESDD